MQMSPVLAIHTCAGTVGLLADGTAASLSKVRVDMRWLSHIHAEFGAGAIYLAARKHWQFLCWHF